MPLETDSPTFSSEDGRPPQCPELKVHGLGSINTGVHVREILESLRTASQL